MAELQEKMKQLLTCSICLERYNTPKTLNCEHSFCRKCLQLTFRKNNGVLLCPTCRYHQLEILEEVLIEQLPTSLHLKQTMELFLGGVESDEISDPYYDETQLDDELKDLKIDDDASAEKRSDYSDTKIKMELHHDSRDLSYYDQDFGNDEEDKDLKKNNDNTSDYVTESDDDEYINSNITVYPKKKKKSMFSKLSKSLFGGSKVLDDISKLERKQKKNIDHIEGTVDLDGDKICKRCGQLGHLTEKCPTLQTIPKTNSNLLLLCSFCNKTDHDLAHCPKASIAARQHQRRQYAKTAAVVGAGYLAQSRPGSNSLLMNRHTPGVVGYNASQGMSRGRGLTTRKKPKSSKSSRVSRCRGTGRGGVSFGRVGHCKRGKPRGVVLLL